jgi:hypothetical protein
MQNNLITIKINNMNVFDKLCPEKYEQLEMQRAEVAADPEFQAWMRALNVSSSYEDRTTKINALELQMQYDTKRYSKLNFNI